jgi:hypothetical protein
VHDERPDATLTVELTDGPDVGVAQGEDVVEDVVSVN